MHQTRPLLARSIAGTSLVATSMFAVMATIASTFPATTASAGLIDETRPHVLSGDAADVLVEVRGDGLCSGTPVTGTRFVVTAAHCVLDAGGEVVVNTVRRDGVTYEVESVLVDTRYHELVSSSVDAAVLVTVEPIPGPSAVLGGSLPDVGELTLAGFQPVGPDGELLRGERPDDRPMVDAEAGAVVMIDSAPAGCAFPSDAVEQRGGSILVPCGLIPGASGGGVFAERDGGLVLVGITSTVTTDLTGNGLVPQASLFELIEHPDTYRHVGSEGTTRPAIVLS